MSHMSIAGLVLGAFMGVILTSIPSKAGTPRSGYATEQRGTDIEAHTAGQVLRQPSAEENWQKQLLSLPALQSQNLDHVSARNTIKAAQVQKPLVETFTRDIWSQLSV